ncbi:MAG TPA: bifunctional DNA-formamidopyrimidine glycosylase/DNA-(apurinic or apyrimidinic site) lyase [Candidatus Saccharimonadales bacterium]|nr:bifunctional DNA-formamidopyrimidine glycosylase/DNA-(apurinic or apyrimidinic site) lyase [Candidatus Saccharimonadales bacterium]
MPELPEIETLRTGLGRLLPGRRIAAVDSNWSKSFPNSTDVIASHLIGAKITSVTRRAKVLIVNLTSQYSLVVHLKMTGQLVFRGDNENFGAGHPSDSLVGQLPDKSTRVTLEFIDGAKLFFNDQRKFGWMRLIPTAEILNLNFFKKIGPEPLSSDFNWQILRDQMMTRKNSIIKVALLDQTVVAGIGNIYADESLWGARIHPMETINRLTAKQFQKLYDELTFVLHLAIEKGGSTDRNYVDAEGRRGSYLQFARVFRREGQACPRHQQTLIQKIRVAGRGTHICPKCQKLSKPRVLK